MNGTLVQLTRELRITIPKEMLEKMKWQPNDYVLIYDEKDKITIYKAKVEPIKGDEKN